MKDAKKKMRHSLTTAKRIKGTSKKLYKGTAIKFAKNPFNAKPLKKEKLNRRE